MVSQASLLRILHFKDFIWNIKNNEFSTINFSYQSFRLGSLINRVKEPLVVQNDKTYKRITIKTKGQGVCIRDEKLGSLITTKKQFYVHKNQFAISKIDARNGAFGIIPEDADNAIITENFWVFDIDEDRILKEYLLRILSSNFFTNIWQTISHGSGNRLYLDKDLFARTLIPVPSISEQKKIINEYQKKILEVDYLEKKANEIEKQIDGLILSELGATISMEKREIGLSLISFKELLQWNIFDSSTSFFSTKYHLVSLSQLCISKPIYGAAYKAMNKMSDCRYIRITDINEDGSLRKEYASADGFSEQYLLNDGDFLFARSGATVGKSFLYMKEYGKAIFAGYLIRFQLNKELINPLFLLYFTKSSVYKQWIKDNMRICAQPNINSEQFLNSPIILPPLSEQEKIVIQIKKLKQEINELRKKALNLKVMANHEFETIIFK